MKPPHDTPPNRDPAPVLVSGTLPGGPGGEGSWIVRPFPTPDGPLPEPLPDAALPPRNQPLRPAQALRDRAADLARQGRWAGVSVALLRLVLQREPLPQEVLASLADDPGGDGVARLLALLPPYPPAACASQLGRMLAAWIDSHPGGDPACAALAALARYAPSEHLDRFIDALDSGERESIEAALGGLVLARSPEGAAPLIEFLRSTRDLENASVALAGLLACGDRDSVAEGSGVYLDLLEAGEESSPVPHIVIPLAAIGVDATLGLQVIDGLWPLDGLGASVPGGRLTPFCTHEDPAAGRRAAMVLPRKERKHLLRLCDRQDSGGAIQLLGGAGREALHIASGDNPSFAPLAARLDVFLQALLRPRRLARISPAAARPLAVLAGTLLAKAIRGRDARADLEEADSDPRKFRDLILLDEPWLSPDNLAAASTVLSENVLRPLRKSPCTNVARHASLLLATRDPASHVTCLIRECMLLDTTTLQVLHAVAARAGDALTDAATAFFLRAPHAVAATGFFTLLDAAGTRRAARIFRHYAEHFAPTLPADVLLHLLLFLGDRELVLRCLDRLREGRVDLAFAVEDSYRHTVLLCLRRLLEFQGIEESPERLLAQGMAAFRERSRPAAAETPGSLGEPQRKRSAGRRPLVRDAPKTHRNAPCPCGSGKKFKKCCGK